MILLYCTIARECNKYATSTMKLQICFIIDYIWFNFTNLTCMLEMYSAFVLNVMYYIWTLDKACYLFKSSTLTDFLKIFHQLLKEMFKIFHCDDGYVISPCSSTLCLLMPH